MSNYLIGLASPKLRALSLVLLMVAMVARLVAQDEMILYSATESDGYVIDKNADGHGDVKIQGRKVGSLIVGESADAVEAKAWIPFVLTKEQKAAVMQPDVSVSLRVFLSGASETSGLQVDIDGAGYRTAYRVNQSDFDTLRKQLFPNALNASSEAGRSYGFDVTRFVKEEAARPDAEGVGFGFLLQLRDGPSQLIADGIPRAFRVGSSSRAAESERPALVIAVRPPVTNPPESVPDNPGALRVLIIGNSILKNSPLPRIGWAGNWGMAASAPEYDFAHLLMARIRKAMGGRSVVFMLHNMAFWESTWPVIRHDIPLVTYARDFEPDIIVSCISENTGLHDDQVAGYEAKYGDMISIIAGGRSGSRHAEVVVRGSFWAINGNTDLALSRVAAAHGWPYVKCSDLGVGGHLARSVGYYLGPAPVDASVLNHPSDQGMEAIAERIWKGGLSELLVREFGGVKCSFGDIKSNINK